MKHKINPTKNRVITEKQPNYSIVLFLSVLSLLLSAICPVLVRYLFDRKRTNTGDIANKYRTTMLIKHLLYYGSTNTKKAD